MNDFDLLLEFQLRHLLAPVVAGPVPARRKRVSGGPFRALNPFNLTLVVETMAGVPVTVVS